MVTQYWHAVRCHGNTWSYDDTWGREAEVTSSLNPYTDPSHFNMIFKSHIQHFIVFQTESGCVRVCGCARRAVVEGSVCERVSGSVAESEGCWGVVTWSREQGNYGREIGSCGGLFERWLVWNLSDVDNSRKLANFPYFPEKEIRKPFVTFKRFLIILRFWIITWNFNLF